MNEELMALKERFRSYRALKREVTQLREQLADMESTMYSPRGQRFTSTPRAASPKGHTMDDLVAAHVELTELHESKALELCQELVALEKAVQTLTSPTERAIMRHYYFDGLSWEKVRQKISDIQPYSEAQLFRYHKHALQVLSGSLDDEERCPDCGRTYCEYQSLAGS